jgi:hypothetical protein
MCYLRNHLSGWAKHESGILKKERQRLSSIIDDLEALVEVRPLSTQEIKLKNQSNIEIVRLLREEDLRCYQCSKSQFISEGDANTRYFHRVTNGRHRKKRIHSLNQDEGIIEGQDHFKSYITNYYKNLFGPQRRVISLWMSPKQMTYPKFHYKRMPFLLLNIPKRK